MSRLLNVVGYRLGFPALERLPVADAESMIGDALHLLSRRRSRPLFLWLHFMDCHLPYLHHPEISRLQFAARLRFATETEPYPAWYPPEQAAAAWRAYTAEAAYLDGQLERLLDVALAPPRHRRRAVVLVADHGEEFLDHGAIGHGGSFYQELVSIPLIVGGDPVRDRAGSVEEEVVDLLDVAPTVLALAGIPDPALPGQDLLGPLRPVEHVATALGPHVPWPHLNESFARREGRWKAILQPGRPLELYDLVADPGEQQNLAEVRPELATRLSRPSLLVAAAAGERPSVVLTEEEIRRLRALGYVQ